MASRSELAKKSKRAVSAAPRRAGLQATSRSAGSGQERVAENSDYSRSSALGILRSTYEENERGNARK